MTVPQRPRARRTQRGKATASTDRNPTSRGTGPPIRWPCSSRVVESTIPRQVIETSKEGIGDAYTALHEHVEVLGIRPFTEIRTDWYTFMFGIGSAKSLAPVPPPDRIGPLDEKDNSGGRLALLAVHERLIEHLRTGDIDAVVEMTKPDVQTAIRDYTAETNAHTELHSADELRSHLEQLYNRFTVRTIELLHRHVEDWLVFSELWWRVEVRLGVDAGRFATFRTAELCEVAADGRLTCLIGHGTQLELEAS